MLNIVCVIAGILVLMIVLWETFETIVLPRRVTRQFRLDTMARRGPKNQQKENP